MTLLEAFLTAGAFIAGIVGLWMFGLTLAALTGAIPLPP